MAVSYVSQAPNDQAAWPDNVAREVGAGASCEAVSIIVEILDGCRVEGDAVIFPQWVQFKLAARLERIRGGTFDVDLS